MRLCVPILISLAVPLSGCANTAYPDVKPMSESEYRASNRAPECEEFTHPTVKADCITKRDGPKFSAESHEAYAGQGTATVSGQGFLRQVGGGVVTCAGEQVVLTPATGYFKPMLDATPSVFSQAVPQSAQALQRTATCNAQGGFRFDAVPPGSWVLQTHVRWMVAGRPQGGALRHQIAVSDGKTVEVMLTDQHLERH